MLSKNILNFLNSLKRNNNREWFHKNKALYDSAKKEFEIFVNLLINEVHKIDKEVVSITAKDCVFRIYRDVRFSMDKTPYKTNFGVFIVKGGKNSGNAGYYLHVEPGNCFLGGGVYMPPSNILKAIRTEIYENTEEFKSIIQDSTFRKKFGKIYDDDQLKLPPRGFPKDFPDIDLLKYKNYTIIKSVTDQMIQRESFIDEIRTTFKAMYPFNQYINRAIVSLT